MAINIPQHLQNRNYPASVQVKRIAWAAAKWLFRATPGVFPGLRNALLRVFGASIGRNVHVHPSVEITFPWNLRIADDVVIGHHATLYALAPIEIEANVLISHGVHLCAGSHDYRQPNFPIDHRPIRIGTGTWIAVEAFVGPGAEVGHGSVVGARAVVMRDTPPLSLVGGNPARVLRSLQA